MSFVGKWIGGLAKDLGIIDEPAAPPPPPAAPTMVSAGDQMDAAAQTQARAMAGGKTSTMLNGAMGVDDKKNTSKILLGQ